MLPKLYCINLDKRPDRWKTIQDQFSKIPQLTLIRFPAIEDKQGWLGCGRSHMKIIRDHMDDKDNSYLMVIEDDCQIKNIETFNHRLQKIIQWLSKHPDQWEIFNGNPSFELGPNHFKILDSDLKIVGCNGGTTNFLIYNKNIKPKLLQYETVVHDALTNKNGITPKRLHIIDKFLANNFVCITSIPFITCQRPSYSNIDNKFINNSKRLKKIETALEENLAKKV